MELGNNKSKLSKKEKRLLQPDVKFIGLFIMFLFVFQIAFCQIDNFVFADADDEMDVVCESK